MRIESHTQVDVIPGWEEALTGMRAGGMRKVNLPPSLWSGSQGVANKVPADAVLEFDFTLNECRKQTLVERFGQQNLILGSLIALIGFYEVYLTVTG